MSLFHFGDSAEHGHGHGTPIEALDPRVKLGVALLLALWVGLLPAERAPLLGFVGVGLVVVGALADIPPATVVWRASAALPFVLVPGLLRWFTGALDLAALGVMAGRGYTAAMVATVLVSVTPFPRLLAAASALGLPDLLVQTTALVYRYLLVLRERATAMVVCAACRGYGPRAPERFGSAGAMVGALLLRSLDRSERVHRSMLARGWTGRFPLLTPMRMRAADWAVATIAGVVFVGSLVWMR